MSDERQKESKTLGTVPYELLEPSTHNNPDKNVMIYHGRWTENNTTDKVIVKRFKQKSKSCTHEIDILEYLNNPSKNPIRDFFYPKLLFVQHGSPWTDVVLQDCGIDLFDVFFDSSASTILNITTLDDKIQKLSYLLSRAMSSLIKLHMLGKYHGDIKPENFVVDPHTRDVKLIDFESVGEGMVDNENFKCTPMFCHPMLLQSKPVHGVTSDKWSFGQICLSLYCGFSLCAMDADLPSIIQRQLYFYRTKTWVSYFHTFIPQELKHHESFPLMCDFVTSMCYKKYITKSPSMDLLLLQDPFLCYWQRFSPLTF